jgi:type II secretory pathway pseudopilin PulG
MNMIADKIGFFADHRLPASGLSGSAGIDRGFAPMLPSTKKGAPTFAHTVLLFTKKRAAGRNERGFTLVESIVAGAISVIIGAVLLTILAMNNHGVSTGALNTKAQMQYQIALDEIGRYARRSPVILAGDESWPVSPTTVLPARMVTSIWMFDTAGNKIRGYQNSSGILQEYIDNTIQWQAFRIGKDTVHITGATFQLTSNRKQVIVNISVKTTLNGLSDTVLAKQETFLCR